MKTVQQRTANCVADMIQDESFCSESIDIDQGRSRSCVKDDDR